MFGFPSYEYKILSRNVGKDIYIEVKNFLILENDFLVERRNYAYEHISGVTKRLIYS